MMAKKQFLLRISKDYDRENREKQKEQELLGHSDGLSNISKNLLTNDIGLEIEEDDQNKTKIDWVAPTNFGLDNSVRLIDAVKEIGQANSHHHHQNSQHNFAPSTTNGIANPNVPTR